MDVGSAGRDEVEAFEGDLPLGRLRRRFHEVLQRQRTQVLLGRDVVGVLDFGPRRFAGHGMTSWTRQLRLRLYRILSGWERRTAPGAALRRGLEVARGSRGVTRCTSPCPPPATRSPCSPRGCGARAPPR